MDPDLESYLLLLLSDGNLPTGSFVSSSGLESHFKHGFGQSTGFDKNVNFISDSLSSYAHLSLPFLADVYTVMERVRAEKVTKADGIVLLEKLDVLYEAMTLNHVARRASKAQGVALLTLYSRGFSRPTSLPLTSPSQGQAVLDGLVDEVKLLIRRGNMPGHLPICWAILTATLQLSLGTRFLIDTVKGFNGSSLERSQHLHLFLHARSLLSASIRLNTLGPYAAQQILLHAVRHLVDDEMNKCRGRRTSILSEDKDASNGPFTTWPLGEILAARHDLQHSRIFNS